MEILKPSKRLRFGRFFFARHVYILQPSTQYFVFFNSLEIIRLYFYKVSLKNLRSDNFL